MQWRTYLQRSDDDLATMDVGVINLLFALGLPGSERIDLFGCIRCLDTWADNIGDITRKLLDTEFGTAPEKYDFSEPLFRMVKMIHFLQRSCGVLYNEQRIVAASTTPEKAEDLFIFGAIQGPGGGCGSLPVLYAAVGRRLGYPIRIVTARQHVFCRWDDPATGIKVNIEGTNHSGVSTYTDDHYRTYPQGISREQEHAFGDLASLTPRRELALFLGFRGDVLRSIGNYAEAIECYAEAAELEPNYLRYPGLVYLTARKWWRTLFDQGRVGSSFEGFLSSSTARRWPSMPLRLEKAIDALRTCGNGTETNGL